MVLRYKFPKNVVLKDKVCPNSPKFLFKRSTFVRILVLRPKFWFGGQNSPKFWFKRSTFVKILVFKLKVFVQILRFYVKILVMRSTFFQILLSKVKMLVKRAKLVQILFSGTKLVNILGFPGQIFAVFG